MKNSSAAASTSTSAYTSSLISRISFGLALVALVLPWVNPFEPGPADAVVQYLLSMVALAVLFLLSCRAGDPIVLIRLLAVSWLVAALLSTAMALVQYAGAASLFSPWVNQAPPGTVYANLRQRNLFASLSSLGLVSLFWLAGKRAAAGVRPNWLWILGAAWLGLGNGLSASRTGLLELLLVLGLFGLVWRRGRAPGLPYLIWAALLGYGFAVLLLPLLGLADAGLLGRLQDEPQGCMGRTTLWSNVLYLIAQQPLTGWGWGNLAYAHFVTLFPNQRFCAMLDNAHNLPLHVAVEFGLPVALLLCGYLLWRLLRARPWVERDGLRQWAWAALAVMGLHSLLEYPLWYGPFQLAAIASLLTLMRSQSGGGSPTPSARWFGLSWRLGAALALLTLVVLSAQDYARGTMYFINDGKRLAPFAEGQLAVQPRPWLFDEWLDFSEVANTPVTSSNAAHMLALSERVVQWRPVPAIIEPLLRSAVLAQRHDLALAYVERYKAAYPPEYAEWAKLNEKK